VKLAFYATREISPENKQMHVHALILIEDDMDCFKFMTYIETHLLKAYVDKVKEYQYTKRILRLMLKYIQKDLLKTDTGLMSEDHCGFITHKIDFTYSNNEVFDWNNFQRQQDAVVMPEDPFID